MSSLFLLSTEGCHLCTVASDLLKSINVSFDLVDIVEDEQLVALYGATIPVVIAPDAEQALYWPFDEHELTQYVEHYGISKTE